jgi:hypothetical protein
VNGFMLDPADARPLLEEYNRRCQPVWNDSELDHKLTDAQKKADELGQGYLLHLCRVAGICPRPMPTPRPVGRPASAIEEYLKGFRCAAQDLITASPIKLAPDHCARAIAFLEALYSPGELINSVLSYKASDDGKKARPYGKGLTRRRGELIAAIRTRGIPQNQGGAWLRMNPLDGKGIADRNVAAFRFALIEFDGVPIELQLALLTKLPLPIAAILSSGGQSLHAWIRVDAESLDEYRGEVSRLQGLLSRFGVDAKTTNPSRLAAWSIADTATTCARIQDFINLDLAQADKQLTAATAASLIEEAKAIRVFIGCP